MKMRMLLAGLALGALGGMASAETQVTGSTGGNVPFSNYQPSLVLTQSLATQGLYPPHDGGSTLPYLGMVHTFAGTFSPFGMAPTAGQLLPVSQNTALFSIVGTTYGGDGRTSFGVPNLVGKTPIGVGQGPGLANFQIGQQIGSANVALGVANMPAHAHEIAPFGQSSTVGGNVPFDTYQPSLAMTYMIAADGIYPSPSGSGGHTMIGEVGLFAGNFQPGGWLRADGRTLQISQYDALFSIIGTTYGGDGRTTFALPDLRGRAVVGAGHGPGLSDVQLGELTGMPVVSLTEAQMAPHTHDASSFGGTTSVEGGGQPFSTEQPGLGLNYLIALQGYFPSRDCCGAVPDSDPFLGEVIPFAGAFAPRGWALAQGQILQISQYQALYALLGTTYGGDGRSTFALPDLRGRVVLGSGNGFFLGQRLGTETTTLSVANLPAHTHSIDVPAAVPEPGSWALMIAGFALAGGAMRRRVRVAFA